jgi:DNA-binding MarR family transcriptional regulator
MNPDELQAATIELRTLTGILVKVARQDINQRLANAGVEISSLQYGILFILDGHTRTLSELSPLMVRDPATLLHAVDSLEKKGLLTRGQDPHDRRRTPLMITALGKSVLEQVPQASKNDLLSKALSQLGNEKVVQLLVLLNEVNANLSKDKFPTNQEN